MQRRDFITLLSGTFVWPLSAHAQQRGRVPRVGVLWHAGSAEEEAIYLGALRQGLVGLGCIDGRRLGWNIVSRMSNLSDLSVWLPNSLGLRSMFWLR